MLRRKKDLTTMNFHRADDTSLEIKCMADPWIEEHKDTSLCYSNSLD